MKEDVEKAKPARGKKAGPVAYAQLIERLEALVESMEAGELPLEEALETFAEGVQLIKQGEDILSAAEQRVEQLLASGDIRPLPLEGERPARPGPEGED